MFISHNNEEIRTMEVLIAAGHSDSDPGAVNGKLTEAKLATELRDLVANKLRAVVGVKVVEDGLDGKNLPLIESIKLAAGRFAFELHFNAGPATALGVECISNTDKKVVSQKISQGIAAVLGTKVRGTQGWIDESKSQHSRLGFVRAGGVIIEVCFLSNNVEIAKYLEKKQLVADAIVKGILTNLPKQF